MTVQAMALLTLSGNPVATSLCEGEALPKMVAVLTIRCELMIAQGIALLTLSGNPVATSLCEGEALPKMVTIPTFL